MSHGRLDCCSWRVLVGDKDSDIYGANRDDGYCGKEPMQK